MLEPAAAAIIHGSKFPISHAMNRSSRASSFKPDFFSPKPRRVKGKGKAPQLCLSSETFASRQCQAWTSSSKPVWCYEKERMLMVREVVSVRERERTSSRRAAFLLPAPPPPFSSSLQRRHASQLSEPPDSASEPSTSQLHEEPPFPSVLQEAVVEKFRHNFEAQFVLDATWEDLEAVIMAGAVSLLTITEIITLCDKLLDRVEPDYETDVDVQVLHTWGRRISDLIVSVDSKILPLSEQELWKHLALSRASSLCGQVQQALEEAHLANGLPFTLEERAAVARAYECMILSIFKHYDALRVLEFIISQWDDIFPYLSYVARDNLSKLLPNQGRYLQRHCFSMISRVQHPDILLSRPDWDIETRQKVARILVVAYLYDGHPMEAYDILNHVRRQGIMFPITTQLRIVQALVKEDCLQAAVTLFSRIPNMQTKKYFSAGLYLFGHVGNNMKAQFYYDRLAEKGWVDDQDKIMLMHAFATNGRAKLTVEMFDKLFPEDPETGVRANNPVREHYGTVIHAHSKAADMAGINVWLQELAKAGHQPDTYIYTMILHAFALRGDMDSVAAVLRQMRASGVPANVTTYISIISLLANRRDPVAAEAVYKRAMEEGIAPTRRLVATLMNAHVEAGSWRGVIRAFDYINYSSKRKIRLTIEIYNTLLKAYVDIGTPFNVVLQLFNKLERSKVTPDVYTFALLIQSASDHGYIDIAEDLLSEVEEHAIDWTRNIQMNVYLLTIVMSAYLRFGHRDKAKAIYDDMYERGLQPTSVTFSAILRAYGSQQTEEGLQIAEQFIKDLMGDIHSRSAWDVPSHGRPSALDTIYVPLMRGYLALERGEDVERVFQERLDAGGDLSLGSLTTLLDLYRRSGNIEAVLQLWPQIFQTGLKYAKSPALFGELYPTLEPRYHITVLCVPLSLYIDALSAAGFHHEIAAVWKTFQINNLTFDSHNWNHLAVALVRAGELERAFQVIEKVIIPYQNKSSQTSLQASRVEFPTSPLVFDDEDMATREPESEMSSSKSELQRRLSMKSNRQRLVGLELEAATDFIHPLYILHNISPVWSTWQPHSATLQVLHQVLQHLTAGGAIRPTRKVGEDTDPPVLTPEQIIQTREHARELLTRIRANYPQTVRLVLRAAEQEAEKARRR